MPRTRMAGRYVFAKAGIVVKFTNYVCLLIASFVALNF